ncbi:MAG: SDR family NAD(P)-dependent oxidoreductase [Polyangiaceae bacterium]
MSKRVAVVTGANRGIGAEVAKQLATLGHRVVVTARDAAKAREYAERLQAAGADVRHDELDVASDESVQAFFERLRKVEGRIDILVNNAGAAFAGEGSGEGSATRVRSADVLGAFDTNAVGALRMLREALPMMNRAGFGRVVNVSSGMGGLAEMDGGYAAYRISKAALNAVTRVFHAEAVGNVKVNSVCPGWVRTDMGGAAATRSVEEGAASVMWAATLGDDGPSGGFFRDGEPTPW